MAKEQKQKESEEKIREILEKKAGKVIEIDPAARYLVVFKAGTMPEQEQVLFRDIWRSVMAVPMMMVILDNPAEDIKVLELK